MTNTTTNTHLDNILGRQKRYLRNDIFYFGFVLAALAPVFGALL